MELEIVSGGVAQKEERCNHQERSCHHHQQRQGNDRSPGEICGVFCPRGGSSLRRRRVQQGMASSIRMWLHTDCCLSHANEQSTARAIHDPVIKQFGCGDALWKTSARFHGKLTWLPPCRKGRSLDYGHSRWNKPGAKRSARETASGPLSVSWGLANPSLMAERSRDQAGVTSSEPRCWRSL